MSNVNMEEVLSSYQQFVSNIGSNWQVWHFRKNWLSTQTGKGGKQLTLLCATETKPPAALSLVFELTIIFSIYLLFFSLVILSAYTVV